MTFFHSAVYDYHNGSALCPDLHALFILRLMLIFMLHFANFIIMFCPKCNSHKKSTTRISIVRERERIGNFFLLIKPIFACIHCQPFEVRALTDAFSYWQREFGFQLLWKTTVKRRLGDQKKNAFVLPKRYFFQVVISVESCEISDETFSSENGLISTESLTSSQRVGERWLKFCWRV